jgi:hypothetical protein
MLYKVGDKMIMNMEQVTERELAAKTDVLANNLPQ